MGISKISNAIDVLKSVSKVKDYTLLKTSKFSLTLSNFLEVAGLVVLIISILSPKCSIKTLRHVNHNNFATA